MIGVTPELTEVTRVAHCWCAHLFIKAVTVSPPQVGTAHPTLMGQVLYKGVSWFCLR